MLSSRYFRRTQCEASSSPPAIIGVFSAYRLDLPDDHTPFHRRAIEPQQISFFRERAEELAKLVARYPDISVEVYLTRGLSAESDFMLRLHSTELDRMQRFLIEFQRKTYFGRISRQTTSFIGVSKGLNYISKDKVKNLNEKLMEASYVAPLPPKYAIVIPIRKSSEWWARSDDDRLKDMVQHTEATLIDIKNTNRRLYHATGLTSDADFLTYFETADLAAFNSLCVKLMKVRENQYHVRWGAPVIVSTLQPSLKSAFLTLTGADYT